ncbi:MAG: hypothetical protein ACLP01_22135 [Solirubrobacteraceae bacterium]
MISHSSGRLMRTVLAVTAATTIFAGAVPAIADASTVANTTESQPFAQFGDTTPAIANTTSCSAPALTQPFLSWGDSHYYVLAPGQRPDSFTASGWTLSGGASLTSSQLADGSIGTVLSLRDGASAISPAVCMNSSYPTARTLIRTVSGAPSVSFNISHVGQPGFDKAGDLYGQRNTWTLSNPLNLQTANMTGWQLERFEFVVGGESSDVQLYNFYLDPYSSVIGPSTLVL